jgi:hypothetical protein
MLLSWSKFDRWRDPERRAAALITRERAELLTGVQAQASIFRCG